MTVRVLIFGPLAQELGAREVKLDITAPVTVSMINEALAARFPQRAGFYRTARLAVNSALAGPDRPVRDGDEIALIELVGGG